jgi:transcriptional repressor of dcmA and dcmR
MQDPSKAELLDIREAAEFLRVSETSLRRWTNAGRLRCLRIGGRRERRFRRSDLLAFLGSDLSPAGSSSSATHLCGLYTSDASRAQSAGAFLAGGLASGGQAWLIATTDVQRSVIDELARARPSVRDDLRAGRLVLGEYCESVEEQIAYWRTGLRAALDDGVRQVYAVGDVSAGPLGRLSFAQILEYEGEYVRTVVRAFPIQTLCQYDARTISGLDAAGLLEGHDAVHH